MAPVRRILWMYRVSVAVRSDTAEGYPAGCLYPAAHTCGPGGAIVASLKAWIVLPDLIDNILNLRPRDRLDRRRLIFLILVLFPFNLQPADLTDLPSRSDCRRHRHMC
jgi:hypothetical protein